MAAVAERGLFSAYVECDGVLHLLDEVAGFPYPGRVRLACGAERHRDQLFLVTAGVVEDACERCEAAVLGL